MMSSLSHFEVSNVCCKSSLEIIPQEILTFLHFPSSPDIVFADFFCGTMLRPECLRYELLSQRTKPIVVNVVLFGL